MSSSAVNWFNADKDFDFMSVGGDGPDLSVHHTEIQADELRQEIQPVEFDIVQGQKGPHVEAVDSI